MIYDALIVVSFGGPEKTQDVIPFLENVLRGRNVPRERMLQVAEHYYHFGGRSPINDQNRELIAALRKSIDLAGLLGQSQLASDARRYAVGKCKKTGSGVRWRLLRRPSVRIRDAVSIGKISPKP